MMHFWWCGICERTAVDRQGDTCVRCAGKSFNTPRHWYGINFD